MALKLRSLSFIYLLLNHIHSMLQEPHRVTVDSGTLRGCAEVGMERWCDDVFSDINTKSKIVTYSYIIKEMLRSIYITLCWPKKPPVSSGILAPFVWKPFFCYCSGFFIALLRLNMMWLTWENELSNVPLQSESHARTSSLLVITHTEVLFCTEYVCTAPLPTVCYYFKCKKTHILPLFDVKVKLMSSNEALFVLFLI